MALPIPAEFYLADNFTGIFHDATLASVVAVELLLTLAETLVLLSVSLFLSSLTGPILAGFLSLALFILGRSSDFIKQLADSGKTGWSALDTLLNAAYYVLPDFHLFAVSGAVNKRTTIHGEFFTWSYVGWACCYAAIYITIMLGLTMLRLRRKDLV